ncbi:Uncharacterized protein, contains caspase domain [Maridesulfovibrio ferrireducens]|uniref:Uncharacterized protein, contains caspase domain n=1 Tax=Maridesulfovibrio ferrireducens TaxID=246191 RepID=A0A1G9BPW3_9BACT|nr:caspase family protein [Maridesulfovibrio ferrireducens]SDK41506.1 Uncharacterized protein, contains caspase domain [Maridesulfovibrio ferrireducens]
MKKLLLSKVNFYFFVFLTGCCLFFGSAQTSHAQSRLALLVGNAAYKNGPLRNPINDINAMSNALKKSGFEVMVLKNGNRAQIGRAIDEFGRKLTKKDVGLFYFSGHGLQVKGRNYLVPIGMKVQGEADVQYEAIDAGRVLAKMEDAGNRMNIVILDACRNNPFKRSFRSAQNGLAQMDAPTGSFIAFATAPGTVALDGKGSNSPYVSHMVKNMGKKNLTIEKFFKTVRIGVIKDTSRKQTPWESSSLVGDFYFSGKSAAAQTQSQPSTVQSNKPPQSQSAPTPAPRPAKPKKSKDDQILDMLLN